MTTSLDARCFKDAQVMKEKPLSHDEIFTRIKSQITKIDFQEKAHPDVTSLRKEIADLEKKARVEKDTYLLEKFKTRIEQLAEEINQHKITTKHYLIITIEVLLEIIKANNWNICLNNGFIYLYNGAYWKAIDKEGLQKFFGEVAETLGVPKFEARHYAFRDGLVKQFYSMTHLAKPKRSRKTILINFQNGTLHITSGKAKLKPFDTKDFLTYQLPFAYDTSAECEIWQKFLDEVLPDQEKQNVLAEYLASSFLNNTILKLEKCLMMYGTGSNGKGVVFEVISALFGQENISNYSLSDLTNDNGYFRAMIVNKLLNYSSENGARINSDIFKQLASNEPVSARLPHEKPFEATDYAKLVFNTNTLPKDGVEQTDAFFRRFLIIPFDVVIPEVEQDRKLHLKIIANELPGVFNWIIEGLYRVLKQEGFSNCQAAVDKLNEYRTKSDSVRSFIEDRGYQKSIDRFEKMSEIFYQYKCYCNDVRSMPVSQNTFGDRIRNIGFTTKKMTAGQIIYLVGNDDCDKTNLVE